MIADFDVFAIQKHQAFPPAWSRARFTATCASRTL
jgi:hypothetical protein